MITALFIRVVLIISVFYFIKDLPKQFSDITGIKSEGMGLNLKERALAAGSLGYAGLSGHVQGGAERRKALRELRKDPGYENMSQTDRKKAIADIKRTTGKSHGFSSMVAARNNGAYQAKNFKDMMSSANKGNEEAQRKDDKNTRDRIRYYTNGDKWPVGKAKDVKGKFDDWAGANSTESLDKEIKLMEEAMAFKKKIEATDAVANDSKVMLAQSIHEGRLKDANKRIQELSEARDKNGNLLYTQAGARSQVESEVEAAFKAYKEAKTKAINDAADPNNTDRDVEFDSLVSQQQSFILNNSSNKTINSLDSNITGKIKENNDQLEKQLYKLKNERAKIVENKQANQGSN